MIKLTTNNMNKEEFYGLIGFVLSSRNRTKVLKAINEDYKMPSEIGRELDMNSAQKNIRMHSIGTGDSK